MIRLPELHDEKRHRSVVPFQPSALWLLTDEPLVNELVGYLETMRRRIAADPRAAHTFTFSRTHLTAVRSAFARMIRRGEEKLHRLCELLCASHFDSPYTLHSVVIGEVETTRERFTLVQPLLPADLYSHTDLDLGTRQLRRLRYHDGRRWSRAALVANMVEYQPDAPNGWGIHKFISRIKAEEQIWNKVVDTIFGFDRIVRADKQLRHLGRFVKDVFGVKAIVGGPDEARVLHKALRSLAWTPTILDAHGVPMSPATARMECIEVKDYMAQWGRKSTGWEAIKSVFRWWDTMIEVQVQPLANFHREREALTAEGHEGFKARRDALRNQVADRLPLFEFYRDLAMPVLNELQNTSGHDDFYTIELSASKRATGRWSVNTSFSYRWNLDNSSSYFGNSLRALQDVATPNDLINTNGGRYVFTTWAFKVNGTYEAKYGLRITPSVRNQSGQPYGRTVSVGAANGINYGTARILTEPIDSHRQDTITIVDVRVEKAFKVAAGRTLSVFMDGYNLTNSNAATNINWSSGSTYLTPSTIIPPRLARFGAKFDW